MGTLVRYIEARAVIRDVDGNLLSDIIPMTVSIDYYGPKDFECVKKGIGYDILFEGDNYIEIMAFTSPEHMKKGSKLKFNISR